MLIEKALAVVRRWLTTSKTVSTEGKYFADAKSIKDLKDEIDGKASISDTLTGMSASEVTGGRQIYTNGHDFRVAWESSNGNYWLLFYIDTVLVCKIRAYRTYG